MKIKITPQEANQLTSLMPANLLSPTSGLSYDGEKQELTVPDQGAVAGAVNAIVSDANWKTRAGKVALKAYAADVRYRKEVGGVVIDGVNYSTDRETQAKMTGAYILAQANPDVAVDWKLSDGSFASLDASTIGTVAMAIGGFVQSCFGTEAAVHVGIDDGSITSKTQIDAAFNPPPVI